MYQEVGSGLDEVTSQLGSLIKRRAAATPDNSFPDPDERIAVQSMTPAQAGKWISAQMALRPSGDDDGMSHVVAAAVTAALPPRSSSLKRPPALAFPLKKASHKYRAGRARGRIGVSHTPRGGPLHRTGNTPRAVPSGRSAQGDTSSTPSDTAVQGVDIGEAYVPSDEAGHTAAAQPSLDFSSDSEEEHDGGRGTCSLM